jgi:parvulin-like peptidyl-prolyl isomerase
MKIKTLAVYAVLLLVITALISLLISNANQSQVEPQKELPSNFIAATVNSTDIAIAEIDREIVDKESLEVDELYRIRLQVLESITQMYVLRDEAIRNGVIISDLEIQKYIDQRIELLGVDRFNEELRTSNLTPEQNRQQLHILLLVQKYSRNTLLEITSSLEITDQQVDQFYLDNRELFDGSEFAHIFLSLPRETDQQQAVIDKAANIIKQLNDGADFTELTAKYSEDASTKDSGGYLGTVSEGLSRMVIDEVLKLKANQHSQNPVILQNGIHIIKRLNEKSIPIEDMRENIEQQLMYLEQEKLFKEKMDELRSQAEVTINLSN